MTYREQTGLAITMILRKHGLTVETLSMNYGNGSDNVSREKKAAVVQEIWRSVFMSQDELAGYINISPARISELLGMKNVEV